MGRGRFWVAWGATVFALSLVWEVGIYLTRAWPIYHPFAGLAAGALLVVFGFGIALVEWRTRRQTGRGARPVA